MNRIDKVVAVALAGIIIHAQKTDNGLAHGFHDVELAGIKIRFRQLVEVGYQVFSGTVKACSHD